MDDYDIETRTLDIGDTLISDYNLQAYVPIPIEGAAPVKEINNRADMSVRVVWKDAGGLPLDDSFVAFVLGTVYQADITLTAKQGYAFDPLIRFSYPVNAVETQSADNAPDTRALSVGYKITAIPLPLPPEDVDLTGLVPAPVMGGSPVTSFYAGTYGWMMVWKTGGAAVTGLFQAAAVYTAELTLYPAPGYTLAGSSFTYTGSGTLNAAWNNTGSALTG
jgi:hypothetical protein